MKISSIVLPFLLATSLNALDQEQQVRSTTESDRRLQDGLTVDEICARLLADGFENCFCVRDGDEFGRTCNNGCKFCAKDDDMLENQQEPPAVVTALTTTATTEDGAATNIESSDFCTEISFYTRYNRDLVPYMFSVTYKHSGFDSSNNDLTVAQIIGSDGQTVNSCDVFMDGKQCNSCSYTAECACVESGECPFGVVYDCSNIEPSAILKDCGELDYALFPNDSPFAGYVYYDPLACLARDTLATPAPSAPPTSLQPPETTTTTVPTASPEASETTAPSASQQDTDLATGAPAVSTDNTVYGSSTPPTQAPVLPIKLLEPSVFTTIEVPSKAPHTYASWVVAVLGAFVVMM